ncbi:MAG: DUF116 domain-containing protein [Candidatus Coatesbacteria bacterium]|nr:DUF116 domain-containing protein [Candidatus Coatesbacteria bacterium]
MKKFYIPLFLVYSFTIGILNLLVFLISRHSDASHINFIWISAFLISVFLVLNFLVILIASRKKIPYITNSRILLGIMRFFWIIIIGAGKLIKDGEIYLWQGYIEFNNAFFRINLMKARDQKVLLLLPHCLQLYTCGIRITGNIDRCKGCGKCVITDIKRIIMEKGLSSFVATGGTLARKIVAEVKPDIIIASACERDLGWGIYDTFPMPVYGILNERPEGPCKNTKLDIAKLEEILNELSP